MDREVETIVCHHCNETFSSFANEFGTYCRKCKRFIEPTAKNIYVKEMEEKHEQNKDMVRAFLRKYWRNRYGNK